MDRKDEVIERLREQVRDAETKHQEVAKARNAALARVSHANNVITEFIQKLEIPDSIREQTKPMEPFERLQYIGVRGGRWTTPAFAPQEKLSPEEIAARTLSIRNYIR